MDRRLSATRCRGGFPTRTRRSRTARSSSCASRRWRSSSTSASSATRSSPGKHTLTTDNIPVLTKLKSWPYGFNSPFKADVYFVVTRLFTGNKWGTSNPVMLRDNDFGIVRVRAFGTYDFKIVEPKTFLREVAGSDHNFRLDEFSDTMRSRIVSIFTDAIASAKIPVLDVASRYTELGEALLPLINPAVTAKYGIEITQLHRRERVGAARSGAGHRQAVEHGRDRQPERLREVPDGQGLRERRRRRAAGTAAELAVGFGLAQQMMQDGFAGGHATPTVAPAAAAAAAGAALPELLSPGRRRAGARRVRGRRDGGARVRRAQGQEDRHRVADLPRGAHRYMSVDARRSATAKCNGTRGRDECLHFAL